MRIRIAAPALVGALVLGGVAAAPAAFAANTAPTIGKISATSLVFGPNTTKTYVFTTTVSDDSGIKGVKLLPWLKAEDGEFTPTAADMKDPDLPTLTCKASSKTTSVCTYTEKLNSHADLGDNFAAGPWYTAVLVTGKDGGTTFKAKAGTFSFRRTATLTVDAAPEPVKKNGTLTVTGQLNRADWATAKWTGFGKQPVKLQFLKKGAKAYTTVKTVTTSSTGALKTTVKATAAGSWRYVFAGTTTTAPVNSASDAVVLK